MEEESNEESTSSASSSTASSKMFASNVNIKQEEEEDSSTKLKYQRNLEKVLGEYTKRYEKMPKNMQSYFDEQFDEKLQNLDEFHSEFGHWDVPTRGKYQNLYSWVRKLHLIFMSAYYDGECYGNCTFPRHRYEKVVAIGFPFELRTSSTTSTRTVSSKAITSSTKIKEEEEEDDNDGTLKYQRNLEKVLDEYTERYEAQPEKSQKRYDDTFDNRVQALVDFHRTFGHWNIPKDERILYNWFKRINYTYKDAYFRGKRSLGLKLPRHRYEKLVEIGYPFHSFTEDNGSSTHCNSTKNVKDGDNAVRTSLDYQENLDKVLDQYDKRYEKLTKARQKVLDAKFNKHFEDLVCFHREYGHWKVPSTKTGLYNWLLNLHEIYRCAYCDGESYDKFILPRHRFEKLVTIEYPFEELVQDKPNKEVGYSKQEKISHSNAYEEKDDNSFTSSDSIPALVSSSWAASTNAYKNVNTAEEEKDTSSSIEAYRTNLDKVLNAHTEAYERNIKNRQEIASRTRKRNEEEDKSTERGSINYRRNLDEAISEYTKKRRKLYDENFDLHFQMLVEFHNVYGHCEVPKTKKEYRQLHNWVESIHRTYRKACFHGMDLNGDITLTRERYDRLVAIGFTFNANESKQKDPTNHSRFHLEKHTSTTAEGNAIKASKTKMQKQLMTKEVTATIQIGRKRSQTDASREEVQSLKAKILQLEKENETHYETIYRLKDEKESLVEQIEEQNKHEGDINSGKTNYWEINSVSTISNSPQREISKRS